MSLPSIGVHKLLMTVQSNVDDLDRNAKKKKADELTRACFRQEQQAVKAVEDILRDTGRTMSDVIAGGLTENLLSIERIDYLITISENRRNASVRELEQHRAVLSAARYNRQKLETDNIKVIEAASRRPRTPHDNRTKDHGEPC
jgi:hypothetical protein